MAITSRHFLRAVLLTAGLAAVSAHAAFPHAGQIRAAFVALDASRNETITEAEWQRGTDALFQASDRDHNGFIDTADLPGSAMAPDTFLRVDRDRDGRLSAAEFGELRRTLFRSADIDRNDTLDIVEYELLIVFERVGWQDRNGSERVEPSELRESLARALQELDADGDGQLSPAEAAYLRPAAFTKFDKDEDKSLTLDELVAGYRKELGG